MVKMGFREEVKILECGCKIGRAEGGLWFYDFICEKHLPEVQENGHYSYEKAIKLTEKLNAEIRTQAEWKKKRRELIKKLDKFDLKVYVEIRKHPDGIPVIAIPHNLMAQGAWTSIQRLLTQGLVEYFKAKHGKREVSWVRAK